MFSGFSLDIDFFGYDDGFDEESAREALLFMAERICIDKTYVAFKGTKFKKVFFRETGWDELCDLVWKAKKRRGLVDHLVLRKTFESMIIAYMNYIAELIGYDSSKIEFQIDPDSDINLQLIKDVAKEWKTYRGPWQDWPENN